MTMYNLIRTTPEGAERSQGPFAKKSDAARAAGRVLSDNVRTPQAEAQRFSSALSRKDLGTEWAHTGSGYRFRIEKAA